MTDEKSLQRVRVGAVELACTTMGDHADPSLLLVAGLGAQLISWEDDFCRALVDRGIHVVRFDNRDAGLSTHLGEVSAEPAYGLSELAGDAAGLIDALGLDSVHVVGVSMGGMIAQLVAIEHPDRVRSLTSIMSTTGDPSVGHATEAAAAGLTAPPALTREAVMEGAVVANRIMGSPGYPMAADELQARAGHAFDRAYDPAGFGRQLQACVTAADRTQSLRGLHVPTLVIHGADDTLIDVSGGRATAAAVPGAELLVLEGVGHEVPRGVWPVVVDRIAGLVARAERDRSDG